LPRGQEYELGKKHWCRFVARKSHSLKEAETCSRFFSHLEAIVNQRPEMVNSKSLKLAEIVAAPLTKRCGLSPRSLTTLRLTGVRIGVVWQLTKDEPQNQGGQRPGEARPR